MKNLIRNAFDSLFGIKKHPTQDILEVPKNEYKVFLHLLYRIGEGSPQSIVSSFTTDNITKHDKNINLIKDKLEKIHEKLKGSDEYINLDNSLIVKKSDFVNAYMTT